MRDAFVAQMQSCDPERLIFLDESGSHIAMTRTRAWAPRGKRAHGIVPRNRGRVTTMLGALSIDGIEAMMAIEGGTTAKVFLEFIDKHLAPKLRPGDIVVMDNLGAHHATGVRERIEARGAKVLYQPDRLGVCLAVLGSTDDESVEYDDEEAQAVARELPILLGTIDWTAEEAGDLLAVVLDAEARGGIVPDDDIRARITERIWDAEQHLELRSIDKEQACEFVAQHHSLLPYCNPRGMMYAFGAFWRDETRRGRELIAVATAGTVGTRRVPRGRHLGADEDRGPQVRVRQPE